MAERSRPALVDEFQPFSLQFGYVHITGTLRLARFTHQTQVKDVADPFAPQFPQRLLAGYGQPQGVGPAARAVALVERRPERRAHGSALGFAAGAVAVAHFDGADETFLFFVVEDNGKFGRLILWVVTEVLRHSRRIDDLAGVEQAVGVEHRFHLAER